MKTIEQAEQELALQVVEQFKTLPKEARALALHRCKVLATPTKPQRDVESYRFNARLHPMLLQADVEAGFMETDERLREELAKPTPPLPAPTLRDFVTLAKWGITLATPVVIVWFGYGLAVGLMTWAMSLAWLAGYAIGAVALVAVVSALPKPDFSGGDKQEETRGGNQTVIVNVFTSKDGDVNVNKNEF